MKSLSVIAKISWKAEMHYFTWQLGFVTDIVNDCRLNDFWSIYLKVKALSHPIWAQFIWIRLSFLKGFRISYFKKKYF